jgi:hypothetical protein
MIRRFRGVRKAEVRKYKPVEFRWCLDIGRKVPSPSSGGTSSACAHACPAPTAAPSAGKRTKCRTQKPIRHFSTDPRQHQCPAAVPALTVCTSWSQPYQRAVSGYRGFWTGIRRQSLFLLVNGGLSDLQHGGRFGHMRDPTGRISSATVPIACSTWPRSARSWSSTPVTATGSASRTSSTVRIGRGPARRQGRNRGAPRCDVSGRDGWRRVAGRRTTSKMSITSSRALAVSRWV